MIITDQDLRVTVVAGTGAVILMIVVVLEETNILITEMISVTDLAEARSNILITAVAGHKVVLTGEMATAHNQGRVAMVNKALVDMKEEMAAVDQTTEDNI